MKTKHLIAVAGATALLAAGCGSDSNDAGTAPGNGVDRAFVAAMVPHHQSAVKMARIAERRGTSAFVTDLAADIIRTQSAEIETMRREDDALDTAGVSVGELGVPSHMMGMDGDTSELEKADPFDAAFLEMMVPHHDGAIAMAEAELGNGADPELKALARDIVRAQQREIDQMHDQLGGPAEDHAGH